ncbi:MAG: hypothetical protein ACM3Q1_12805 [Bacteroidales bacterium]
MKAALVQAKRKRFHHRLVPLVAGLGLASGLILLAHPFFAIGVWQDSQPMTIGLLVAASLCLLGIAAMAGHSPLARRAAMHPVTLAPLALALWSSCALPLADKPWRSLFGAAQNGQGILWYVALSACSAAALIARPLPRLWRLVLIVGAATSLVAAILGVQGLTWLYPWLVGNDIVPPVRLLQFNEYLAYPALALVAASCALWQDSRRKSALGLALAAVAVLLISRNRTAWLCFPLIFLGCLWLGAWLSRKPRRRALLAAATAMAALVPTALIALSATEFLPTAHALWSRTVIVQALAPSLAESARTVLAGHGWGAVPDELIRHLSSSGIRFYQSEWGGLERDIFHSHNALIEAMLSVGLPGAILTLALPAAVLAGGAPRRLWLAAAVAMSWAALDAFWFMVPANLPFIALAAAAAIGRPTAGWRVRPPILAAAALALAALCGGGAAVASVEARQQSRLNAALASPTEAEAVLPLDIRGDGHAVANILSETVKQAVKADNALPAPHAERLREIRRQAEAVADGRGSPTLSMALVNATTAAAFAGPDSPLAEHDGASLSALWEGQLRRVLAQAPKRLDVLAPYLNWLLVHQHDRQLAAMVAYARSIDGQHPVTQWFEGAALLQSADAAARAAGLARMRAALRNGLERFMPVDESLKAALN